MLHPRRVIWLFDPGTALLGFSAATSLVGGAIDAENAGAEARDTQRDIDFQIEGNLISAGRDLRDNREVLKVDAARLRARAASQGAQLSDANIKLLEGRLVTESLIRDRRIEQDRGLTTDTLLERRRAVGREGRRRAKSALLGGALGGASTLLGGFS